MTTRSQKELASRTPATIASGLFLAAIMGTVTGTIQETRDLIPSFYTSVNFYAGAHLIAGKVSVMLSIIVTILFAVSTIALVVLVYNTFRTDKREGENTTGTAKH